MYDEENRSINISDITLNEYNKDVSEQKNVSENYVKNEYANDRFYYENKTDYEGIWNYICERLTEEMDCSMSGVGI